MLHHSMVHPLSSPVPGCNAVLPCMRSRSAVLHVRRSHRLAVQGFRERDDAAAGPKTRAAPEPRLSGRSRSATRAVQGPSQQRTSQQLRWQDGGANRSGPGSGAAASNAPVPLSALRKVAWRLMGRGGRCRTTSHERDTFEAAARDAHEAAEQAAAVRTDPTGAAGTPIGRFGLSSARVGAGTRSKPSTWATHLLVQAAALMEKLLQSTKVFR